MRLPLSDLPNLTKQRRKVQATASLNPSKMCGADTETVDGKVWLFSTEFGVWEINSLQDLVDVLWNKDHATRWKQGKGKKQKTTKGLSSKEFFFWNLKYDCQAVLKLFSDDEILSIMNGGDEKIDEKTGKVKKVPTRVKMGNYEVEIKYLEGKYFSIHPKNMMIDNHRVGKCVWWDISQFYGKMRLQSAGEKFLNSSKVEVCFDGSKLDVTRLGEPEYRDFYREDIEKYAIQDAVLAGELARLKRQEFVDNDVRFIKPYSVANLSQRNMMDTCEIPTLNNFQKHHQGIQIIQRALTSYRGGFFSTAGSGRFNDVQGVDLVSAYPYIMYNLPDITKGTWIQGSCSESWWNWIEKRKPHSMGYAEVYAVFERDLPFYPLITKSKKNTMVGARIVRGWFTADEIAEAKKWPHIKLKIGEWVKFVNDEVYPFRPFIDRLYAMKMNAPDGSVERSVAKLILNSAYGKTIQNVEGNIGTLYNPMAAAVCTGATRARLAEIIRLNDYQALSIATDGIIFPRKKLKVIPPRPIEAPFNLGDWEVEVQGDLLVQKSGVYSVINDDYCKTVFRGNASYFLREYADGGLFRFCDEHADEMFVTKEVTRPISAKQARMKSDLDLINIFTPQNETMSAFVNSDKRRWLDRPHTFGELKSKWWPSLPQERI